MIDVSIIIVNYNTFELTCQCIRSIYKYTFGITYEIILVDNASTERNSSEFSSIFPDILFIKSGQNLGFSGGNNIGLGVARGKTILLLNSDAELTSNAIGDAFSKLYQLDADVKVISCRLTFPDGTVQHSCGRFPSVKLQLAELFRIQKVLSKRVRGEYFLGGFFDHSHAVYPDWVWGTFFMFKKEVLSCFPGEKLPDTYFLYMEDMEWCFYIAGAGGRIYFDPTHHIIHHNRSSTRSFFGENLDAAIKRNYVDLVKKHRGSVYAKVFFALTNLNIMLSGLKK